MNKTIPLILSLFLVLLVSGCTQTGRIINESAEPSNETGAVQQVQEQPNETEQNVSTVYTEPQNITQPKACPETCDDRDNCTYDYCSEDTGYECVHAIRICLNSVKTCPDGVEVSCKNLCINNSCTECNPDCSEHQLPICELTQDDCSECEILDTETCKCAKITACVHNDNCCPEGCNYTNDNDCEVPEQGDECLTDSDCDDANACTIDRCEGTPKNCSYEEITDCIDDDGCCPVRCDYTNDTDCEEQFGNDEDVIINEIMYNPSTDQCRDDDCEWVELYNMGTYKVNLSGWTLDEKPFEAEIINSGEYIIIARQLIDGDDADIESFEYYWGDDSMVWGDSEIENYNAYDGNMILNNKDGDTIILQSPDSYYDSVTYSDTWGADGNSKTLERYENSTWSESLVDGGTPGSQNSI